MGEWKVRGAQGTEQLEAGRAWNLQVQRKHSRGPDCICRRDITCRDDAVEALTVAAEATGAAEMPKRLQVQQGLDAAGV